jgi:hypothetical protein
MWLAATGAALVLLISIVLIATRSPKRAPALAARPVEKTPARAPAPVLAPAPAPTPPSSLHVVRINVVGPEGGKLYLDGRHMGRLPMEVEIPKGSGRHAVTVKALGYLPYSEQVSSDDDHMVTARLRRPPPAPIKARPVAKTPKVELKDPFER